MSTQIILWILGTIILLMTTVIGALAQAMWTHTRDYRDFRTEIAASNADIAAKLTRVMADIGTHETGLRGQVHKLASDISPYIIAEQRRNQP